MRRQLGTSWIKEEFFLEILVGYEERRSAANVPHSHFQLCSVIFGILCVPCEIQVASALERPGFFLV